MKSMTYLLAKHLRQYPWLRSPANRVILVIGIILVLVCVLFVTGSIRESSAIAKCKAEGGIPIYKTASRKLPEDWQGNGQNQEYKTFVRCSK